MVQIKKACLTNSTDIIIKTIEAIEAVTTSKSVRADLTMK